MAAWRRAILRWGASIVFFLLCFHIHTLASRSWQGQERVWCLVSTFFLFMAKQNSLAIVIPAYKSTFLAAALDSIAAQTCHDFTLYIGDDCSPNPIGEIVDAYSDKINLVYKRFDTNLGGHDLVAQWERCIDMTQGEEWLWLFSDDDVMEEQCVEEFYKMIKSNPNVGLVHFNVSGIFGKDEHEKKFPLFPPYMKAKDYLDEKLKGKIVSFVVEFVIRRDVFNESGRFEKFDLAWGSDFISWIKFATKADGIYTCKNAKVKWRSSGENVSTDDRNEIVVRKLKAFIEYTYWIYSYSQKCKLGHPFFYSKCVFGEISRRKYLLSIYQFICIELLALRKFGFNMIPILFDGIRYVSYRKFL